MPKGGEFFKSIRTLSKDVFILSTGIFVAQLIPLFLQPFIKRIFTPEDFGTYDVYLKSFSILVALSCLKYENAILLPKKDTDAKHVMYLCLIFSSIIFLIILITAIFFNTAITQYFEGFTLFALLLLPCSVLSYSVFNVFNMYLIRRQKFVLSSTSKISRKLSEGIVQVTLGYFKNSLGLIIGDVMGNLVQGVFSFWKAKSITSFEHISKSKLKRLMYEYRELPIFTLVPNILNTFVLGSLTFLILGKFSLKEVGYLEFTQKILSIPSVFISIAISQVLFQRVSKLIQNGKAIVPLLWSIIGILAVCSGVFILIIQLFAEELFTLIGGSGWDNSGVYAKILVYASAVMLIFSPLGKVLIALKKFKVNSIWEMSKFAAILALFYLDNYAIKEYLKIYTIIIIIFYIIYGFTVLHYSYKYQGENAIIT